MIIKKIKEYLLERKLKKFYTQSPKIKTNSEYPNNKEIQYQYKRYQKWYKQQAESTWDARRNHIMTLGEWKSKINSKGTPREAWGFIYDHTHNMFIMTNEKAPIIIEL